jgi:hypothetical protein
VPNPFNPRTTIVYELLHGTAVRLRLYDPRGRLVRSLLQGWQSGPRRCEVVRDGTDGLGRPVASGVYLYRLEAGGQVDTKMMTLVR